MTIHSYLTFNGNCREAMSFYRDCLGGDLVLETVGDSPLGARVPCSFKSLIVQATLVRGDWTLVGSDMADENGRIKGNAVAMLLQCDSAEQASRTYGKLASGGQQTHPLGASQWGWTGDLIDKYGNHWIVQYEEP
ncbi:VOC family protein [Flavobacterium caeni]|uniref:PhnB protein n=1 Tax=Flavobacterium caeni TaxID=490189 RepID=A0A1G5FR42_9FLAO|nr:VOC family protein [Flavobacterium caeni]SCY41614.1 PhnB protein [Flavobacterium caeni]